MTKIKTRGKVGILLAGVFVILALFHVAWAFRGPPTSVQILPTIPDEPAIIPSQRDGLWISSLGVAGALFLAAIVVLASANLVLTGIPGRLRSFAGIVLGGIFVLRAAGDFRLFGFFKSVRGTEFAFWDNWLYSPLCLVIGVGVLWLVCSRESNPEREAAQQEH